LNNNERGPTVFERFAMTELETIVAMLQTRSRGGGVTLELPTYDRRTQRRGQSTLTKIIERQTVLIWDGVIAVELARRAGVLDCAVHVSTDEKQRKLRFLRYYARRGKSSADALRLFDERQYDEHVPILELGKQARWQVTLDGALATTEAEAISR
jgi:uridine kinase